MGRQKTLTTMFVVKPIFLEGIWVDVGIIRVFRRAQISCRLYRSLYARCKGTFICRLIVHVSLADAEFSTGREISTGQAHGRDADESTLGGETTCIVCMANPKTHLAAPCGHHCACDVCADQMKHCPICRQAVAMWGPPSDKSVMIGRLRGPDSYVSRTPA